MVWDCTRSWRNTSCQESLPSSVPTAPCYPQTGYVCAFLTHILPEMLHHPWDRERHGRARGRPGCRWSHASIRSFSPCSKKVRCSHRQAAWGLCPGSSALGSGGATCQPGGEIFPLDLMSPQNWAAHVELTQAVGAEQVPATPGTGYCSSPCALALLCPAAPPHSGPQPVPPVKFRARREEPYRNKKQAQEQGRVMLKWAQLSENFDVFWYVASKARNFSCQE